MPQPTPSASTTNPSHAMLHNAHVNVKAFGATGDNVTDDTTAIQAAIDVASAAGGGTAYFPPGSYKITSTLTINGSGGAKLVGTLGKQPDGGVVGLGSVIIGSLSGSLIARTNTNETQIVIEDLGLWNQHETGKAVSLVGVNTSGIYRCHIAADSGIVLGTNCFETTIADCFLNRYSTRTSASIGITATNHTNIYNCNVVGFYRGVQGEGVGCSIVGGRFEVNETGLYLVPSFTGFVGGLRMEANDTAILASATGAITFSSISILGTAGSPSGGSALGIWLNEMGASTVIGCTEEGTHTTAFIKVSGSAKHHLSFVSCSSTTAWTFDDRLGCTVINCAPEPNVISGVTRPSKVTPTYSTSITPDSSTGNWQTITVTNGTAFTINAPTTTPDSAHSQALTIEIFNNSGGAMGAITWNAAFKLVGGAFTNPATANKRFIAFKWNGTHWVEQSRAGADYA